MLSGKRNENPKLQGDTKLKPIDFYLPRSLEQPFQSHFISSSMNAWGTGIRCSLGPCPEMVRWLLSLGTSLPRVTASQGKPRWQETSSWIPSCFHHGGATLLRRTPEDGLFHLLVQNCLTWAFSAAKEAGKGNVDFSILQSGKQESRNGAGNSR